MSYSTRQKKPAFLLTIIATLGLFAAACSNSTEGSVGTEPVGAQDGGLAAQPAPDEIKPGGKLVLAVEAETAAGFTPATAQWDAGGYIRANAVLEPLFKPAMNGTYEPFLVETAEPNEDYTQWTLKIREGIEFHNGEPLNAEIVAKNLTSTKSGLVGGAFLDSLSTAEAVDEYNVLLTFTGPHVAIAPVLSTQAGYIVADEQLQASASNQVGISNEPIGTGPFVFAEFVPGSVNFRATKNPNYWREDKDGNSLPYLDEIEIQTIPAAKPRVDTFKAGGVDAVATMDDSSVLELRSLANEKKIYENVDYTEVGYLLLNSTNPPLDDIRIRKALAISIDREAAAERLGGRAGTLATGPFPPGAMGYLEDSGYPMKPDPVEARRLVDDYKAEKGISRVTFEFVSVPDPQALQTLQLYQALWSEVGIDVTLKQVEQAQFIGLAATGNFHAFTWRNHWGADPIMQNHWWNGGTADNAISFNFGRINDEVINENLTLLRSNPDPAARQEAAENINRRFAEQFYNLWSSYSVWTVGTQPYVVGIQDDSFPDGSPVKTGIGGHLWYAETWLNR